jgi:hypothetical protein
MVEVVRTVRSCNWALYHPRMVGIFYGTEQLVTYQHRIITVSVKSVICIGIPLSIMTYLSLS